MGDHGNRRLLYAIMVAENCGRFIFARLVIRSIRLKKELSYNQTISACRIGHITQAIVNNFAPLLFLTFQRLFDISLDKIALLVSINFFAQLVIDLLSVRIIPRIGYRKAAVLAHLFCAVGLIGLCVLPYLLSDAFAGLLLAVILYAVGGGMIEVMISPMVEACPTERKEAEMSLLHSFYCWGCVLVILGSTLFFVLFGVENWRVLACLWALIPLFNAFLFSRVPIRMLEDEEEGISAKKLLSSGLFWVLFIVMLCSGAAEQSMSQWASAFAEAGLQVSKTAGDLAGPCAFAILMGISRLWYSKNDSRLSVTRAIFLSGLLCIGSYLLASLSASPLLGLIGCALCGLSVGVFWPGTLSLAAKAVKGGGTRMFAFLALGGDMGCSLGPALVGLVSASRGDDLHAGLFSAILFPALLLLCLLLSRAASQRAK